jgi:hypothetical protein
MKRLLLALLFPLALFAQTPVMIQNANFQAPVTFTASDTAGDQWVPNTVPGWTIGPGPGVPGTLAGIQKLVSACGANAMQGMYTNDPTVTQDVGPQQAGTYSLTVNLCSRADGAGASATYTIGVAGCAQGSAVSTIPAGTIGPVLLSCPITKPSGDVIISLGCSGGQCDFFSVALTFTPAGPYVFVLKNCGASTCTFTFPIAAAPSLPACGSADGTCSLSIQVCDTSVTPANCLTLSTTGAINIVKNSSTNGQTVTPLVTATSP